MGLSSSLSLIMAFLIQSSVGLSCIDTKAIYQSNECCERPLEDVTNLCITGEPKSVSTLITMEWEADKPDSVDESDRAASLVLPAALKSHVLADLSFRPEGCGELCSSRSIRFVFKTNAEFSSFMEWMVANTAFTHNVLEKHKIDTIKVIAGTEVLEHAKLSLPHFDALNEMHMVKQGAHVPVSFQQVEDTSFEKRC